MTATFTRQRNFATVKQTGHPPKLTRQILADIRAETRRNPNVTIQELSLQFGLALSTIHRALKDKLKLKKRPCIWRPHLLSAANKTRRLQVARQLLARMRRSPRWASKVITADETWVYTYEPTWKQQSTTWLASGEEHHSKVRKELSVRKVMVAVFWDAQGIIHREFVPRGDTMDSPMYRQILRNLRESVRRKRPALWRNRRTQFWLQHDGAGPHRAQIMLDYYRDNNIQLVPHPPYSPDITPLDFFLFARLKRHMRGRRFQDLDILRQTIDQELGSIPQAEFTHAMEESWRKRLNKCVLKRGDYFED